MQLIQLIHETNISTIPTYVHIKKNTIHTSREFHSLKLLRVIIAFREVYS